jgi:hypothetical protein
VNIYLCFWANRSRVSAYEETILGGTIGHRFERGVDRLQSERLVNALVVDASGNFNERAEHQRSISISNRWKDTPDSYCPALFLNRSRCVPSCGWSATQPRSKKSV